MGVGHQDQSRPLLAVATTEGQDPPRSEQRLSPAGVRLQAWKLEKPESPYRGTRPGWEKSQPPKTKDSS